MRFSSGRLGPALPGLAPAPAPDLQVPAGHARGRLLGVAEAGGGTASHGRGGGSRKKEALPEEKLFRCHVSKI